VNAHATNHTLLCQTLFGQIFANHQLPQDSLSARHTKKPDPPVLSHEILIQGQGDGTPLYSCQQIVK
jgi:hypothetical protein